MLHNYLFLSVATCLVELIQLWGGLDLKAKRPLAKLWNEKEPPREEIKCQLYGIV